MRLSTALFFLVSLAVITAIPLPENGVEPTTIVQSPSGTSDQISADSTEVVVQLPEKAELEEGANSQQAQYEEVQAVCGATTCTKQVPKYTLMYLAGLVHGTVLGAKDKISSKLSSTKTNLDTKLTTAKNTIDNKVTNTMNTIDDKVTSTVDDLVKVKEMIKNGFIQFGKDTDKSAKETYVKIKCQDESNRKIIAEKARKLGGKIKDGFKLVAGVLVAAGTTVGTGITNFFGSIKQSAGELYDAAAKKLDEAADAFWAALQKGVNDAKKLAKDAAKAASDAKIAAQKTANDAKIAAQKAANDARTKLQNSAQKLSASARKGLEDAVKAAEAAAKKAEEKANATIKAAEEKANAAAESLRAKLNSVADSAKKKAREAADAANEAKKKLERAPANAKASLTAAYEAAKRRADDAAQKAADALTKAQQNIKDFIGTSEDFHDGVKDARSKLTTNTPDNYQPNQQ